MPNLSQRDDVFTPNCSPRSKDFGRLERETSTVLRQCERFETMASLLDEWANSWDLSHFRYALEADHASKQMREQALVALVLRGSSDAKSILFTYQPDTDSRDHEVFYEICQIEWGKRYGYDRKGATKAA